MKTTRKKPPEPPGTATTLRLLIPRTVRRMLNWRVPMRGTLAAKGGECLIAHVGDGSKLRWLYVYPTDAGAVYLRLYAVRKGGTDTLAEVTARPDQLGDLLTGWAVDHLGAVRESVREDEKQDSVSGDYSI